MPYTQVDAFSTIVPIDETLSRHAVIEADDVVILATRDRAVDGAIPDDRHRVMDM